MSDAHHDAVAAVSKEFVCLLLKSEHLSLTPVKADGAAVCNDAGLITGATQLYDARLRSSKLKYKLELVKCN